MSEQQKFCVVCQSWWRGMPDECPECGSSHVRFYPGPLSVPLHDREAHRQVARIENFAQSLYALPERLANRLSESMHPYDVADAIFDLLAPEPVEEPLAPWEVELLRDDAPTLDAPRADRAEEGL